MVCKNKNNSVTLTISSLNCNGLKGNIGYVTKLTSNHDVTFICEHWLQVHELDAVRNMFMDQMKNAFSEIKRRSSSFCFKEDRKEALVLFARKRVAYFMVK